MGKASLKIKISVQKALNTQIGPQVMKSALRIGAGVAIDVMRRRARAGINPQGKKMPKYSARYKRAKAQMIRGKWKMRDRRTPFVAKAVSDTMALSGRTMNDLYVKSVKVLKETPSLADGEILLAFRSQRSQKINDWQEENGRGLAGLAPANTGQGKRERAEINRAIKGAAKLPRNRGLKIT